MTTPSEQLAKAKAAKAAARKYDDVEVLLDAGLAERRERLTERLADAIASADADSRLASVNTAAEEIQAELDAVLDEATNSLATLRFVQLDALVWGDIAARCPVRLGSPVDEHFGYNMQGAAVLAAPVCGGWLVDGEVVPLTVSTAVDEWSDLFATISGGDMSRIESAIFDLNVYGPNAARAELKKALSTRPA